MRAKLIMALMYKDKGILDKVKKELVNMFGSIEDESAEYRFNFTDYYKKEMGSLLLKRFISFKRLIKREKLAEIRLKTAEIERRFAKKGKRKINIDPGYVTKNAVFMASVKERAHKVYIGKGVFVDMNLILKRKGAFFFHWTFPDYKIASNQEFFHRVRENI